MSETYWSYNSVVPEFLRGRPKSLIIHCLQRMKKSQRFTKKDVKCSNETNGLFHLKSQSGKVHVVDFGVMTSTPSCTCKDWIQFRIPCKHFFAVFEHFEQWKWGSLPKHYLESSHITADVKAFDNEHPTVSVTALHKPLHFVCGSDDPPTPDSADILADPPLSSTVTQKDSDSATCKVHLHMARYSHVQGFMIVDDKGANNSDCFLYHFEHFLCLITQYTFIVI